MIRGVGSFLELLFHQQLRDAQFEAGCIREFRFDRGRAWRLDFAWPKKHIAVEIEGGSWVQGSHTRGKRFEQDCDKYNEAALQGWRVLRFTGDQVNDGRAIAFMRRVFPGSRVAALR